MKITDLKRGWKKGGRFALLTILSTLASITALILGNLVYHSASSVTKEYIPEVIKVKELQDRFAAVRFSARAYRSTGNAKYYSEARAGLEKTAESIKSLKEISGTDKASLKIQTGLAEFEKSFADFKEYVMKSRNKIAARNLGQTTFISSWRSIIQVISTSGNDPATLNLLTLARNVQDDYSKSVILRNQNLADTSLDEMTKFIQTLDELKKTPAKSAFVDGIRSDVMDAKSCLRDAVKLSPEIEHESDAETSLGDSLADQIVTLLQTSLDACSDAAKRVITAVVIAFLVNILILILSILTVLGARRLTVSVRKIASVLDHNANEVATVADQVSISSQSLAEGASEQAASLQETSSSLVEMSSMTKRNAGNAKSAKRLAAEACAAADMGATDVQEMNQAMGAIKSSSDDISKIIKTIDEIAFQTNILALNAAVEAARAGEAGLSFAVVADEVRALAQRSAKAAKETADKIENAINKTQLGVKISSKVATSLKQIQDKARQVDSLVAEIATASHEQNQGIEQINTTVDQMDKITQSNAAGAEETAAAAMNLTAQSHELKTNIDELLQLVSSHLEKDDSVGIASAASEYQDLPEDASTDSIEGNANELSFSDSSTKELTQ